MQSAITEHNVYCRTEPKTVQAVSTAEHVSLWGHSKR